MGELTFGEQSEMKLATGIDDKVKLNNGISMPWLGLGVWMSEAGRQTENAVSWALEAGYRHIDTASVYGNEASVGKAVKSTRS